MEFTDRHKLTPEQLELLEAAHKAMDNRYSPYSHFSVGAAVLGEGGDITAGANVENASYGLTICAERVAMVKAMTDGDTKCTKIAIIARGEKGPVEKPVTPCGACRQFILEMAQVGNNDIEVIMSNTDMTSIMICGINELLPYGFGPRDLGVIEKTTEPAD